METARVVHHTFTMERSFRVPPERVFRAFSEPEVKRRWIAEAGHQQVELFELDFRVDGAERVHMRFGDNTPFPGMLFARESRHFEITPGRRIVMASSMNMGGRCISVSLETYEFSASEAGTELLFTNQTAFFEGSDGPKMREDGWAKLLDKLVAKASE